MVTRLREREGRGASALVWSSWEGTDRIADLNNFCVFWGTGIIPGHTVPGSGSLKQVQSGPVCENTVREVAGVVDLAAQKRNLNSP